MPTNPSNGSFRRMGSKAGRYGIPDTGKAIWEYLRDSIEQTSEELKKSVTGPGQKTYSKHTARAAIQQAAQQPTTSRASSPRQRGQQQSGGLADPKPPRAPVVERPSRGRGSAAGAVDFLNQNKSQSKGWVDKLAAPRHALREQAAPLERIGAGKVGSQGLRTMLSNYGANKDYGNSLAGASASRFKAVKGLVNRPGTWMGRFAVIWVAQEAGKAMADWRGWDKVSWQMTHGAAQAVLSKHKRVNPLIYTYGKLMAGGLAVAGLTTDLWLGVTAPIADALRGDNGGSAAAAQASDLVKDVVSWAGSGFRGPSPWAVAEAVNADAGWEVERQKLMAEQKAERRFFEMVDHNIDRMKDTLALRGVGNRTEIRSAYSRSNQDRLSEMVRVARLGVSESEVMKDMLNRELAKNKR